MIRVREMERMYCNVCSHQFNYPSHYNAHLKTKAHMFKENPQPPVDYSCSCCNVNLISKKDQLRHLATQKHAKNVAKRTADKT